jgi:alkylation response protein AidB-like acyl-CoA dehydrogenase
MDRCFTGGHGVLVFDRLRIPASDVLGEIGKGFRYAQIRLAPARLTHCMRWLGQARRAHDIATEYARKRQAFGKPLGEHEGVGFMLADNDMDLHTSGIPRGCSTRASAATSNRAVPRSCVRKPSGARSTAACRSWAAKALLRRPQ